MQETTFEFSFVIRSEQAENDKRLIIVKYLGAAIPAIAGSTPRTAMCPAALRWLLKSPAQLPGTKAILVRATLLYLGRYALELKSLILGKKQWNKTRIAKKIKTSLDS